jgi:hypothetical protein
LTVLTWENPPFEVLEGDPFHLYATEPIPKWMDKYMDENKRFIFPKFMSDILDDVSEKSKKID